MITLYHFFPALGLPDPSPFCVKVETFLRMVDADFNKVSLGDPSKGPKGKLPYIKDGGDVVPDSGFIVKYLLNKYHYPIDDHLTSEQHGIGVAIIRLLEEHLYWAIVHSRWIDDDIWPRVRESFFGKMPWLARCSVPLLARVRVKVYLYAHGLGRHSHNEINVLADDNLRAVAGILGDNEYILGSRPSSYDASVYAFISTILCSELDTPLKEIAAQYGSLSRYCERMRQAYYG